MNPVGHMFVAVPEPAFTKISKFSKLQAKYFCQSVPPENDSLENFIRIDAPVTKLKGTKAIRPAVV